MKFSGVVNALPNEVHSSNSDALELRIRLKGAGRDRVFAKIGPHCLSRTYQRANKSWHLTKMVILELAIPGLAVRNLKLQL